MRQIVVIAGGLATRLYPITLDKPKSMIEIAGKPFIHHQLEIFKKNNIESVVMCVGYLSEQIVDYVKDGKDFDLEVVYSKQDQKLDTGGAIKNAIKLLDNNFFVIYGDSYLLHDYQKVAEFYNSHNKPGLMTVYKNHNQIEPSRVIVDGIHVKKYQKEPPPLGAIHSEYGLNIFKKNIINRIDEKVFPISRYFDILAAKEELLAYPINKRFYEIGCPEGIADLEKLLKNK